MRHNLYIEMMSRLESKIYSDGVEGGLCILYCSLNDTLVDLPPICSDIGLTNWPRRPSTIA
jgi:hypothetical protein